MKPILQPLFEKIKDFDVETLQGISDEQLKQRAEELQELGMINRYLGDMGKIIDPDDPQGRSIKEVLCGNRAIFDFKLATISQAALKSRCNAMLQAYKLGCLGESSFTESERKEIRNKNRLDDQVPVSQENMKAYIRKAMISHWKTR